MKVALVLLLATASSIAHAAPERMSFGARIVEETGPAEGPLAVTFRIFDAASGGTLLWEEAHPAAFAIDGVIAVTLGSTSGNGLGAAVFAADAYLEVEIAGEVLAPRAALLSVPFALRASHADRAERLGDRTVSDFAPAKHGHVASDITGVFGPDQIACYADLAAEGFLDGNDPGDLVTLAQADARYLAADQPHVHSAADITSGLLSTDRFDAYADLVAGGRIDGDVGSDLVTRSLGDARYLGRNDAYTDLSNNGHLANTSDGALLTRAQLDARYLRSGNAPRVYGCGTYVLANFCPAGNTSVGPNCDDVPAGSFCEADGECGLATTGNCGPGAWYFKVSE
jgi:hypothetical protein